MRLIRLAIPFALMLLVTTVYACANSSDESANIDNPDQYSDAAQEPDRPVLSLYAPRSTRANDAALVQLIDTIQALNPSLQISATLLTEYDAELTDAVQSATPPDVFLTPSYDLPKYVSQGLIDPIPERLINRTSLLQPALDAVTVDGVAYCLPQSLHTLALLYNEDIFAEVGLQPDTIDWSWDTLRGALSATSALTDVTGIALDANFASWAPFYYQASDQAKSAGETEPSDTQAAQQAFTYVASLYSEGLAARPQDLETRWTGEAFAKGKAAMVIGGDWLIPYLASEAPLLDYGVTELPRGPAGNATLAYVNCLAIHAVSGNQELAIQLAEQLTAREVLPDWTWRDGGSLSPYFDVVTEASDDEALYRPYLRSLRYAIPWSMQDYAERTAGRFRDAVQMVIDEELEAKDVWDYIDP